LFGLGAHGKLFKGMVWTFHLSQISFTIFPNDVLFNQRSC
jgi:hypothetical protein